MTESSAFGRQHTTEKKRALYHRAPADAIARASQPADKR